MFSHKILPTVSLSSRMALSLGLAVLGTGSLLFLFPSFCASICGLYH